MPAICALFSCGLWRWPARSDDVGVGGRAGKGRAPRRAFSVAARREAQQQREEEDFSGGRDATPRSGRAATSVSVAALALGAWRPESRCKSETAKNRG